MIIEDNWLDGSSEVLWQMSIYKTLERLLESIFNMDDLMECAYSTISRVRFGKAEREHVKNDRRYISFNKSRKRIHLRLVNNVGNGVAFELEINDDHVSEWFCIYEVTEKEIEEEYKLEIVQKMKVHYSMLTKHDTVEMLLGIFNIEYYKDFFKAMT